MNDSIHNDRELLNELVSAIKNYRLSASTTNRESIERLDAVLARIDVAKVPTYTTGHCENHKKPGGCPLHNLQCGYPQCDRQMST